MVNSTVALLLALVPFVIVFVGILGFKLSSRYVAPTALLVTIILGLIFFSGSEVDSFGDVMGVIGDRFYWTIFEYGFSVAAAFFFLATLQKTGAIAQIKRDFEDVTEDRQRRLVLIGFCFAMILAVVAPAGSNFVIAAVILVQLDFKKEGVGAMCLFGNALTSAFGLLGIAILAIATDLNGSGLVGTGALSNAEAAKEIGRLFAMQMFIFGVLAPLIMVFVYTKKGVLEDLKDPEIRSEAGFILVVGLIFSTTQLLVAWFLGPELPTLLAGGAALLFIVLWEKRKVGYKINKQFMKDRPYFWPFIIMIVLLLITRLIGPVGDFLTGGSNSTMQAILNPKIPGSFSNIHFPYLVHPGTILVLTAIITPFLMRLGPPKYPDLEFEDEQRRMRYLELVENGKGDGKKARRLKARLDKVDGLETEVIKPGPVIKESARDSSLQVLPIIISITAFASIAKLMAGFAMTQAIANTIVDGLTGAGVPWLYLLVIPLIGMLGSGLTGSTTTSNFLFGRLQVQTAIELGLVVGHNSVWEVAGAQILGATAGEMISPMNAVVVATAVQMPNQEGVLIRRLIPTMFAWLGLCMVITFLFLGFSGGIAFLS